MRYHLFYKKRSDSMYAGTSIWTVATTGEEKRRRGYVLIEKNMHLTPKNVIDQDLRSLLDHVASRPLLCAIARPESHIHTKLHISHP
jgi:hypothetical protein